MIITNNPDVAAMYPDSRYSACNVQGIFEAVRDEIHKGARLLSHPLSGSIKPNESPYKSVAISAKYANLDFRSLQIIEDAMTVLRRLTDKKYIYDESILADFRIIDLDHIKGVSP
ncbi:MAG: GrdX family protein [Defluviitaleaceae bacterium]|nr:GrdX family protein [Defluviitaleaceae bacterium]